MAVNDAVARAIENGFSLFRQAPHGLSIAVDPQGRVRGAMDHFGTNDRILVADVPTRGVRTLYTAAGDWPAWVCALFLAGWIAGAAKTKKSRAEGSEVARDAPDIIKE